MQGIKFEKTSYEQFKNDLLNNPIIKFVNRYDENKIKEIYNNLCIPKRATMGSAGYDFMLPFDITLEKDVSYIIPTGIRVKMSQNVVLQIYPRSGLGFKYEMKLVNTVGIIDSDYYNSDNEGHIMLKITRHTGDTHIKLNQGSGIAQGIFLEYLTTEDDECERIRNGGFGSTDT